VLGTTDVGTRGVSPRRSTTSARARQTASPLPLSTGATTPPFSASENSLSPAAPPPASGRTNPATPRSATTPPAELPLTAHAAKAAQDEFLFGEVERRGFFDKTDRNLFEGQDLDVPTYLRKGIKIAF
jgi:cell division protein FtsZ